MGRTLYFLVLLVFSWFGTGGDCTASAPAPTAHTRQTYPEGLAERSLWGAPRQATARLSRAGGASFLQCFALTGEAQTPAGYGAAEQSRLVVRTMSDALSRRTPTFAQAAGLDGSRTRRGRQGRRTRPKGMEHLGRPAGGTNGQSPPAASLRSLPGPDVVEARARVLPRINKQPKGSTRIHRLRGPKPS